MSLYKKSSVNKNKLTKAKKQEILDNFQYKNETELLQDQRDYRMMCAKATPGTSWCDLLNYELNLINSLLACIEKYKASIA